VALEGGQHSAPLQPPTHLRLLRGVDPMRLEHALGDVRTDRGGLHGGRLLSSRGVVHPSATPLAHRCRRAGPSTASVRTALNGYPGVRARTTCISALLHRSPTRAASSRVRPGRVRVPSTMQGHPSCRSRRMRVRRWLTEKRGTTRRRSWRKLHLATDADTGRLVAAALTDKDADDGSRVGPLHDQVDGPFASFTADGAYDRDDVYAEVAARHPDAGVIVPPRSSVVPSDMTSLSSSQVGGYAPMADRIWWLAGAQKRTPLTGASRASANSAAAAWSGPAPP
jgi:hypothetical protein